jgi:hypothetical protein
MMPDSSGLSDEVITALNTEPDEATGRPSGIPVRPAGNADRGTWIEYVVALGADRAYVSGSTEHYSSETGQVDTHPGLGRGELIQLADRLGG